jgi:hypothetical protein
MSYNVDKIGTELFFPISVETIADSTDTPPIWVVDDHQ